MLRETKRLLSLCTERFPSPRPSQHHSLTVIDGVLVLTLMQGDTYSNFNLEDGDLDKSPEQILEEVAALVAQPVEPIFPPLRAVPSPAEPDQLA